MRAKDQSVQIPTDQEDHAINKQALEDDSFLTNEQLASMRPLSEFPELQPLVKRGRPTHRPICWMRSSSPKT